MQLFCLFLSGILNSLKSRMELFLLVIMGLFKGVCFFVLFLFSFLLSVVFVKVRC